MKFLYLFPSWWCECGRHSKRMKLSTSPIRLALFNTFTPSSFSFSLVPQFPKSHHKSVSFIQFHPLDLFSDSSESACRLKTLPTLPPFHQKKRASTKSSKKAASTASSILCKVTASKCTTMTMYSTQRKS